MGPEQQSQSTSCKDEMDGGFRMSCKNGHCKGERSERKREERLVSMQANHRITDKRKPNDSVAHRGALPRNLEAAKRENQPCDYRAQFCCSERSNQQRHEHGGKP